MKPAAGGYRVAVIGASSLLGKELLEVLKEREFPVSRLITPGALEDAEPELPVLDLSDSLSPLEIDVDLNESDLDFVFLAAPLQPGAKKGSAGSGEVSFLKSPKRLASATLCTVIDMSGCLASEPDGVVNVPFLDRSHPSGDRHGTNAVSNFLISAHPATIVISALLLRLAARFPMERVVAQVFGPVSEIGALAIEELQKQTLNLLSFQKIPQTVFGAQLAFNLLPRLGRSRSAHGTDVESRVQEQLKDYLGQRFSPPALRFIHVPVFHSLACSLYVELVQSATLESLTQVLAGGPIRIRKASEQPPSQVEASGSNEIVVDALTQDAGHPAGFWIWAVVDNLRVAAVNAVEIAESFSNRSRPQIQ